MAQLTLQERAMQADRDIAVRKITMGDLIIIHPILRDILDGHNLAVNVTLIEKQNGTDQPTPPGGDTPKSEKEAVDAAA